jgi:hypothetical protein
VMGRSTRPARRRPTPAPSQVTISRYRCSGGSAAIDASSTVRWPAVVLLPAEPGRSIPASGSPALRRPGVSADQLDLLHLAHLAGVA